MFLQDQFQSDNVTNDLNSDEADTHAVAGLKGLGSGSNRAGVLVVSIHAAQSGRGEIVIQLDDCLTNHLGNPIHSIVQVNTIVNDKQHDSVVVISSIVSKSRIDGHNSKVSIRIVTSILLGTHIVIHRVVHSSNDGRSSPATIDKLHLAVVQAIQEAPIQSTVANIANLIVQAALQFTALTPIHLLASNSGQFGNLIAQLSRIA